MSRMVYRWRSYYTAAAIGANENDVAESQRVGEALDAIACENQGAIAAQDVVVAARPSTSALHRYFEWDDRKAAVEFRIRQATELVRAVAIVVPDADTPIPAFTARESSTSRPVFERAVASDAPVFTMPVRSLDQQVAKACGELREWRRRYGALEALAAVVDVIDETVESLGR